MQEDYRKQLFEDCQKELQDEISHHKNYKNKYGKVRRICHTTSTMTGVIPAILSSSGLTVSLSDRLWQVSLLYWLHINSIYGQVQNA